MTGVVYLSVREREGGWSGPTVGLLGRAEKREGGRKVGWAKREREKGRKIFFSFFNSNII